MAKQITPPIPVDHWYGDTAAVKELQEILQTDTFRKAVAVLKEIAGPSFNTLQDQDHNSIRHAWYAGYRDAFNDLHKLSKITNTKSSTQHPDEWTHIES
jgi:hypothetical protein|tara:strand:+ start:1507 stop:1803 length:297 start_codon:yes stop_codon:yes gene_type:complete